MKLNIFKIVQLLLWLASVTLVFLAIYDVVPFKTEPEYLLELFGLFSGASIATNEIYDRRLKKFSTVNVLAIGYVKNCIEPIIDAQIKQYEQQPQTFIKKMFIYIPANSVEINNLALHAALVKTGRNCVSRQVPVYMKNRTSMDISEITNPQTGANYYFDTPNTISSLSALIDYTLEKKRNSSNDNERNELEKKYMKIFKEETEKLLEEKQLLNELVFIRTSIDTLP
jgi:hypothetical protein